MIKNRPFVVTLLLLFLGFGLGSGAWTQAGSTPPVVTPDAPPTLHLGKHEAVSFSDSAKTLVDSWEVSVPPQAKEITLQLWFVQNGHLSVLQTAGAYFVEADTKTEQSGRVYLLRTKTTETKTGVSLPLPSLGFRFPDAKNLTTQFGPLKGGYRPAPRTTVPMPGPISISVYTTNTKPGEGIASNQPFALWVGQASSASPKSSAIRTLSSNWVETANRAASHENQTPLRPLLGILSQNLSKNDALLIFIATWQQAAAPAAKP